MNEKIKELWDKAVTLVEQEPDGDWSLDACKDKFAELIVAESIDIARQHNNSGEGGVIAETIEEHFGVAE